MAKMKPPKVPEVPVPVLTDDDLRRLLAACEGRAPEDRRDMAVLRLFLDSGMRLWELTNLKVGDLDLDARVAIVMGKGRRPRACPFGAKTASALDRYLICGLGTPTRPRAMRCGSGCEDRWALLVSGPSSNAGPSRLVSKASTPTCSATPSPTPG